jgi:hypothetical protein
MKVDKLSISFDPDFGDEASLCLRAEALAEFLDAWESEHGEFTAEDLVQASADLGL